MWTNTCGVDTVPKLDLVGLYLKHNYNSFALKVKP